MRFTVTWSALAPRHKTGVRQNLFPDGNSFEGRVRE